MTLYLVMWLAISYDCPWGLGKAPRSVKELVCTRRQAKEWILTSQPDEMRRRVLAAGEPDPLVLELHRARARKMQVTFEPVIR